MFIDTFLGHLMQHGEDAVLHGPLLLSLKELNLRGQLCIRLVPQPAGAEVFLEGSVDKPVLGPAFVHDAQIDAGVDKELVRACPVLHLPPRIQRGHDAYELILRELEFLPKIRLGTEFRKDVFELCLAQLAPQIPHKPILVQIVPLEEYGKRLVIELMSAGRDCPMLLIDQHHDGQKQRILAECFIVRIQLASDKIFKRGAAFRILLHEPHSVNQLIHLLDPQPTDLGNLKLSVRAEMIVEGPGRHDELALRIILNDLIQHGAQYGKIAAFDLIESIQQEDGLTTVQQLFQDRGIQTGPLGLGLLQNVLLQGISRLVIPQTDEEWDSVELLDPVDGVEQKVAQHHGLSNTPDAVQDEPGTRGPQFTHCGVLHGLFPAAAPGVLGLNVVADKQFIEIKVRFPVKKGLHGRILFTDSVEIAVEALEEADRLKLAFGAKPIDDHEVLHGLQVFPELVRLHGFER